MDSRICQTSTATPAEPGGLPFVLVRDAEGNLYGTTYTRGAYNAGTVFKLSKTGKETTLHTFTGGDDGGTPFAGVILDAKGNLYGTTYGGGVYRYGVVFKLTP